MEFTGERFIPGLQGEISLEHMHRYALGCELAAGKAVLDIACGEGYGCSLLAGSASSVFGVDIDPAAVEHANELYGHLGNVRFLVGACHEIPLPDRSVDVVVSFETIEHHNRHEEMMREIRRVLRPRGILILSSPNRLVYSDEAQYTNPFHVKELYLDELVFLLKQHFSVIEVYGQRVTSGSLVCPLTESENGVLSAYMRNGAGVRRSNVCLNSPMYFVAMCSDTGLDDAPRSIASLYTDPEEDLLRDARAQTADHASRLQQAHQQLAAMNEQLAAMNEQLHQALAQITQLTGTIDSMKQSRFWKIRTQLRRLMRVPDAF